MISPFGVEHPVSKAASLKGYMAMAQHGEHLQLGRSINDNSQTGALYRAVNKKRTGKYRYPDARIMDNATFVQGKSGKDTQYTRAISSRKRGRKPL